MDATTFKELPLSEPIQMALADQGYVTPSPIQAQAIPHLLEGRDLLGCAQTGTGKTAAFSLPILNALHKNKQRPNRKGARVLVLTPTRELATQVGSSLETYGDYLRTSHTLIFGGVGKNPQIRAMSRGVDVLVACPGRLLDLINEGHVDLSTVEFFVLDEVDRMLDMGFLRDVEKIVRTLPRKKQSLFFSATLAPAIKTLAHNILHDPVTITIEPEIRTSDRVAQELCFITQDNKRSLLMDYLRQQKEGELSIVFSKTKWGADKLCKFINTQGIEAEAIHGNRSQPQRERTLTKFRAGKLPVLVATDVAARGVDVKDVTLVVNIDLPNESEAYVHRIGRTGRAGATGRAVSFACPEEHEYLYDIEKLIQQKLPVNTDQEWHNLELAELHQRGKVHNLSTRDNGGNKGRGGRGGQRGGGNRGGGGQNKGRNNRNGNPPRKSNNRNSRNNNSSRQGRQSGGGPRKPSR